jgi:hypothetical protein
MKFLSLRILVVLFAVAGLRESPAASTNLTPVADTHIASELPASNFGTANPLLVGISATFPPIQRGLLRFSFEDIPSGAVVTGVTLRLVAIGGPREASDFDLNRLLVEWSESGATWVTRLSATPWTAAGAAAGADYVTPASIMGQLTPVPMGGPPTTNDFSSPGMVEDVQLWLNDPGTNFGWILHATGGMAGTGRQVASREDPTRKPMLIVEYTLSEPPPATPPTISGTMLEEGSIRFSFNAESNRTYAVEFRDSLVAGNWSVVTNIPALSADSILHITNSIAGGEGYFRVGTP